MEVSITFLVDDAVVIMLADVANAVDGDVFVPGGDVIGTVEVAVVIFFVVSFELEIDGVVFAMTDDIAPGVMEVSVAFVVDDAE